MMEELKDAEEGDAEDAQDQTQEPRGEGEEARHGAVCRGRRARLRAPGVTGWAGASMRQ